MADKTNYLVSHFLCRATSFAVLSPRDFVFYTILTAHVVAHQIIRLAFRKKINKRVSPLLFYL